MLKTLTALKACILLSGCASFSGGADYKMVCAQPNGQRYIVEVHSSKRVEKVKAILESACGSLHLSAGSSEEGQGVDPAYAEAAANSLRLIPFP